MSDRDSEHWLALHRWTVSSLTSFHLVPTCTGPSLCSASPPPWPHFSSVPAFSSCSQLLAALFSKSYPLPKKKAWSLHPDAGSTQPPTDWPWGTKGHHPRPPGGAICALEFLMAQAEASVVQSPRPCLPPPRPVPPASPTHHEIPASGIPISGFSVAESRLRHKGCGGSTEWAYVEATLSAPRAEQTCNGPPPGTEAHVFTLW